MNESDHNMTSHYWVTMKTELSVIGLLLAATVVASAEMRTWTFEKSGSTMQAEVVIFSGGSVILKRPDGQQVTVPIAYLIETNRVYLADERTKQWKEVEVVKIEGALTASGAEKICTVRGAEVNGKILIRLLPASVVTVLNNRDAAAAQIARVSEAIKSRERTLRYADAITPTGAAGSADYCLVLSIDDTVCLEE